MTDSTNGNDLTSAKYLENQATPELDPIIYGPKHTPNPNPLGNTLLFAGIGTFLLVVVCVLSSIGETQKDPSERDGWFRWLVDYSVEKQEREGRAPNQASGSYGPFGY